MQLPPRPVRGSPISAQWGDRLLDYLKAITPQSSASVRVSVTSGGATFEAMPGRGGGAAAGTHPFKVFTRSHPEEEDQWQGRIEAISTIMRSRDWDDYATITGLTTYEEGAIKEESWFPLIPSDAIWLEISGTVGGSVPSTAAIRSWGRGSEWEDFPAAVEITGNSYVARVLIAYTLPGDQGEPVLTQCLAEHLLAAVACSNARTVHFPIPYTRPYIIPVDPEL